MTDLVAKPTRLVYYAQGSGTFGNIRDTLRCRVSGVLQALDKKYVGPREIYLLAFRVARG